MLKKWQLEKLKILQKDKFLILEADTGLGKGFMFSDLLAKVKLNHTSLIVCPSHLISDWYNKLLENNIPNHTINVPNIKDKEIKKGKINIISYGKIIRYHTSDVINVFDFVVIDESHHIKNFKPTKSKTFKTLRSIFRNRKVEVKYKVFLSATMITHSRADLFTPIWFANDEFYKDFPKGWYQFKKAGGFILDGFYDKIAGINPFYYDKYFEPYIHKVTYETALVRRPERVITEFKYKVNKSVLKAMKELTNLKKSDLDLNNLHTIKQDELLNMMQNPFIKTQQLLNGFIYLYDNEILEKLEDSDLTPKQVLNKAKIVKDYSKTKRELVKSIVNNEYTKGNKGLLLYYYKAELESLKKVLPKNTYYHTQNVSSFDQIKEFESGDYCVYVANIKSLGEGVRFKKSQYLIEYSKHYNYGDMIQSRGRLEYVGGETYQIFEISPDIDNLLVDLHKNILQKQKERNKIKKNFDKSNKNKLI